MARSLIEKENRTTITGIIAIVLIVFLIASFMRVNEIGFFKEENIAGGATNPESFLGIRHVQLTEHDTYVGHLMINGLGKRTYYAYPQDNILLIDFGGTYVQAMIMEDADAPGIYRGAYDDRSSARVLLNTLTSQLYVDGLTEMALPPISLTPQKLFDGEVSVAGDNHYFRLLGNELLITTDSGRSVVALAESDGQFVGTWDGRDVLVNPVEQLIIIHELY